jgi:hypothetical protein
MLVFTFEFAGPLLPDYYLLGSPRWLQPVSLINARLVCTAGASTDATVLQLEIDGALIDKSIPIFPRFAGDTINIVLSINRILAAESELRVKCVSGPLIAADAIRAIGLTLGATEASTATPPVNDLWVQWMTDSERLRLFEYDPATHLFTESSAGISATRATIDNATTFLATIQGTTVAQCNSSQQFKVNELICNGGTSGAESPRLEFFIGQTRVASLSSAGTLWVIDVAEAASISGVSDFFAFYGAGVLSAVLGPIVDGGANILAAIECVEPV